VSLVASAGVVGNLVGADCDGLTLLLPSVVASISGDGDGLDDWGGGDSGGEEALAVECTEARVSESSLASDGGQAGIIGWRIPAGSSIDAADQGSQRQGDGEDLHVGVVNY